MKKAESCPLKCRQLFQLPFHVLWLVEHDDVGVMVLAYHDDVVTVVGEVGKEGVHEDSSTLVQHGIPD